MPCPIGVVRSRSRLVEELDGSAALLQPHHDPDAVHQRPSAAIPFRQHEDVIGAELVDGLLELGPVLHVLAGGLLAQDLCAALGPECGDLAIEVLRKKKRPLRESGRQPIGHSGRGGVSGLHLQPATAPTGSTGSVTRHARRATAKSPPDQINDRHPSRRGPLDAIPGGTLFA
jgi:hypothetical protein